MAEPECLRSKNEIEAKKIGGAGMPEVKKRVSDQRNSQNVNVSKRKVDFRQKICRKRECLETKNAYQAQEHEIINDAVPR